MNSERYRRANELADNLDLELVGSESGRARSHPAVAAKYKRDIATLCVDLAEQERIDGKPVDPASDRQGFYGAV